MEKGVAIFGGGCFWCTEAIFQKVRGINKVESGYAGGAIKNPAYREVCNGNTGHAEVVRIEFDQTLISYNDLLSVFFNTHDPTTLNRQGNDLGTQYRSVIFYLSEEQKSIAEKMMVDLQTEKKYNKNLVTEIMPYSNFYKAEDYHQNYFRNNSSQPYCTFVIAPKLEKFEMLFPEYSPESLK